MNYIQELILLLGGYLTGIFIMWVKNKNAGFICDERVDYFKSVNKELEKELEAEKKRVQDYKDLLTLIESKKPGRPRKGENK